MSHHDDPRRTVAIAFDSRRLHHPPRRWRRGIVRQAPPRTHPCGMWNDRGDLASALDQRYSDAVSTRTAKPVADDGPIAYIQRTRDWYLALGYDSPYRWAH